MNRSIKRLKLLPAALLPLCMLLSLIACSHDGTAKGEEEPDARVFDGIVMNSYTYSTEGERITRESWQFDDEEMTLVSYYEQNEFDADGNLTSSTVYDGYSFDADDPLSGFAMYQKFEYEYENNCIVKARAYDSENTLQEWYTAEYNEAGNYTSYIHYEGEGTNKVIEHRTATYDESGEHYLVETRYYGAKESDDNIKEKWTCDYGEYLEDGIYQSEVYYKHIRPSGDGVNVTTGNSENEEETTPENTGYTEEYLYEYLWMDNEFCIMKNRYLVSSGMLQETVHFTPVDIEDELYLGRRSEVIDGEMVDLRYYMYDPVGNVLDIQFYLFEGENKSKRLDSTEEYEYYSRQINGEMANVYTVTYNYYVYDEDEESDVEDDKDSTRSIQYSMFRLGGFKTVGWAKDRTL